MSSTQRRIAGLLLIAAAVYIVLSGGGGWSFTIPGLTKPTAVTFVYEKDQHAIPSPVLVALSKLNQQGILATTHDVDTTDESAEVPEQYKAVVPAAKAAGLPALVVSAGQKVLRTVKDPKTEAQVLEAAQ